MRPGRGFSGLYFADRAESLLFACLENDCGGGDVLQSDAGGVENGDLRIARPSGLFAENDLAKLPGESGEDALFVRQLALLKRQPPAMPVDIKSSTYG